MVLVFQCNILKSQAINF